MNDVFHGCLRNCWFASLRQMKPTALTGVPRHGLQISAEHRGVGGCLSRTGKQPSKLPHHQDVNTVLLYSPLVVGMNVLQGVSTSSSTLTTC